MKKALILPAVLIFTAVISAAGSISAEACGPIEHEGCMVVEEDYPYMGKTHTS